MHCIAPALRSDNIFKMNSLQFSDHNYVNGGEQLNMNTMECLTSQIPIVSRLKLICEDWEKVKQNPDTTDEAYVHQLLCETVRLTLSELWKTVEIDDQLTLRYILLKLKNFWGCQTLAQLLPDPWRYEKFLNKVENTSTNEAKNRRINHHCNEQCTTTPRSVFYSRVDLLIHCAFHDAAVQLCLYYRNCSRFQKDLFYAYKLFHLLFSLGNNTKIADEMKPFSCHDGLKIVEFILKTDGPSANELSEILTEVLLVRDLACWSKYCCTNNLMKTWCRLNYEQKTDIVDVIQDAGKLGALATTSAHLYLFSDVLFNQYGREFLPQFLPLYLKFYIHALSMDLNSLEYARHANSQLLIAELETHLAAVYTKLASITGLGNAIGIANECLLTAFSLEPTTERLEELERRAPCSNSIWRYKRTFVKPCQGECHCEEKGLCRKDNELPPWYLTKVPNGILDTILPGVTSRLLEDLCALVEGPRCRWLTWNIPWDELRDLCASYMQTVQKLRIGIDDRRFGINSRLKRIGSLIKAKPIRQEQEEEQQPKINKRSSDDIRNVHVSTSAESYPVLHIVENSQTAIKKQSINSGYFILNQLEKPKKRCLKTTVRQTEKKSSFMAKKQQRLTKNVVTFAASVKLASPGTTLPKQPEEERKPVSSITASNPYLTSLLASDITCKSLVPDFSCNSSSLLKPSLTQTQSVPVSKALAVHDSSQCPNSTTSVPNVSARIEPVFKRVLPSVSTVAVPSLSQPMIIKIESVDSTDVTGKPEATGQCVETPKSLKCPKVSSVAKFNTNRTNNFSRTANETVPLPKVETTNQNILHIVTQPGSSTGVKYFVQSVSKSLNSQRFTENNQRQPKVIESHNLDSSFVFNRISPPSAIESTTVQFPTLGDSPTVEQHGGVSDDTVEESQQQAAIIITSSGNVQRNTVASSQPALCQLNSDHDLTIQPDPFRRLQMWETKMPGQVADNAHALSASQQPQHQTNILANVVGSLSAESIENSSVALPNAIPSATEILKRPLMVVKKCSPAFLNISQQSQLQSTVSNMKSTQPDFNITNRREQTVMVAPAVEALKELSEVPSMTRKAVASFDHLPAIVKHVEVNQPLQANCSRSAESTEKLQVSRVPHNVPIIPTSSIQHLGTCSLPERPSKLKDRLLLTYNKQRSSVVGSSSSVTDRNFSTSQLSNEQAIQVLRPLCELVPTSSELPKVSSYANHDSVIVPTPNSDQVTEEHTVTVSMPSLIERVISTQLDTDTFSMTNPFSNIFSDRKSKLVSAAAALNAPLSNQNGASNVKNETLPTKQDKKNTKIDKVLKETNNKNVKLFTCEICQKVLKSSTTLKRHIANHSKPKNTFKTPKFIKVATVKIGSNLKCEAKVAEELKDSTNNRLEDSLSVCEPTLITVATYSDAVKEVKVETVDFKKIENDLIMEKQLKSCSVQLVRQKVLQLSVTEANGDVGKTPQVENDEKTDRVGNEKPPEVIDVCKANKEENDLKIQQEGNVMAEIEEKPLETMENLKEETEIGTETQMPTFIGAKRLNSVQNGNIADEKSNDSCDLLTFEFETGEEPVVKHVAYLNESKSCDDTTLESEIKAKGRSSSRTVKPPQKRCCHDCLESVSSSKKCKVEFPAIVKTTAKSPRKSRGGSSGTLTRVSASGAKF